MRVQRAYPKGVDGPDETGHDVSGVRDVGGFGANARGSRSLFAFFSSEKEGLSRLLQNLAVRLPNTARGGPTWRVWPSPSGSVMVKPLVPREET